MCKTTLTAKNLGQGGVAFADTCFNAADRTHKVGLIRCIQQVELCSDARLQLQELLSPIHCCVTLKWHLQLEEAEVEKRMKLRYSTCLIV